MFEVEGSETVRADSSGGFRGFDSGNDLGIGEGSKGGIKRNPVEAANCFTGTGVGFVDNLGGELLGKFSSNGGMFGEGFTGEINGLIGMGLPALAIKLLEKAKEFYTVLICVRTLLRPLRKGVIASLLRRFRIETRNLRIVRIDSPFRVALFIEVHRFTREARSELLPVTGRDG